MQWAPLEAEVPLVDLGNLVILAARVHLVSLVCQECQGCLAHPDPSLTSNPSSTKSSSHKAARKGPHQILLPTCRHRWAQWDHVGPQVCEVHLDRKDLWAPRVTMVTLAHLGHQASWEREVCKGCLEKRENLDGMVKQEQQGQLAHQESGDCLACQGYLDQKAIVDSQVWMEPKEKWVDLV